MQIAKLKLSCLAMCSLLLVGCASTTPVWDEKFGEATKESLESQRIK
jgi:hypothetical protein